MATNKKDPSLIEILEEETQWRTETDPAPEVEPDPDDFTGDLVDSPGDDPVDAGDPPDDGGSPFDDEIPGDTDDDDGPESDPESEPTDFLNEAGFWIAFVDNVNQLLLLPWAYRRTLFTADELRMVHACLEKRRPQNGVIIEPEWTDKEKELLSRFRDMQRLIDMIPLSEDEVNMLKQPLADVMKKYGITSGPEIKLLAAVGAVFSTRYMPLFTPMMR